MEGPVEGWSMDSLSTHSCKSAKAHEQCHPSLQEALAEASDGSPQKDRNGSSLFCDTLFHLDPEATLSYPVRRWRRGPSASSCSNTPLQSPPTTLPHTFQLCSLPTSVGSFTIISYWMAPPPEPKVSHSPPHRGSFLFCRLSQANRHLAVFTDRCV